MEIYSNFLYLFFICRVVSGCLDHARHHFPCSEAVRCGRDMPYASICLSWRVWVAEELEYKSLGEGSRKTPARGLARLVSDLPPSLLSFLPIRKVGTMVGTSAALLQARGCRHFGAARAKRSLGIR